MHKPRFRYIALDGSEKHLVDAGKLVEAVVAGDLSPDSLVFDAVRGRWQRAAECHAYLLANGLVASGGASQSSSGTFAPHVSSPVAGGTEARCAPNALRKDSKAPSVTGDVPTGPSLAWGLASTFALAWLVLTFMAQQIRGFSAAAATGVVCGQGVFLALVGLLVGRSLARPRPAVGWTVVTGAFALIAATQYTKASRIAGDMYGMTSTLIQGASGAFPVPLERDTLGVNFIVASLTNSLNSAWLQYSPVVEDAGDDWLSPTVLSTHLGRQQASRTVSALRAAATKLSSSLELAYETASRRVDRLSMHESAYREFAEGFHRTAPTTIRRIREFLEIEILACSAMDSLLAVVTRTPPQLAPDGVTLLFPTQPSVQAYNRWFDEVQRLAASEESELANLQRAGNEYVSRVEALRDNLR